MTEDGKKPKELSSSFVVDVEIDEYGKKSVPSVSRLLNRKTLLMSQPSARSKNEPASRDEPLSIPTEQLKSAQEAPVPVSAPAPAVAPQAVPPPEASGISLEIQLQHESSDAAPIESGTQEISLSETIPDDISTETAMIKPTPVAEKDPAAPAAITLSEEPSLQEQVQVSAPEPITLSEDVPLHPKRQELALPSQLSAEPSATSSQKAYPEVKKIQRARGARSPSSPPKLVLWNREILKRGKDPLGKGLAMLLDKGVTSSLFLSIVEAPAGSPVPHFVGTAAVADRNKINLWTGLKWDPTVVPEMWNYFVRTGFVELGPPGTTTNQKSNRNVVRAAFGVDRDEWLTLVRTGPANGCRGVLAILSKKTILPELMAVLPLLTALPSKSDAA